MIATINCFRDERGDLRADVRPPYEVLGWFLEQDIQSYTPFARELAQISAAVEGGETESWQGTGNAHTVTMTAQHIQIENEFTDPPIICRMPHDEFRRALAVWIDAIESGK